MAHESAAALAALTVGLPEAKQELLHLVAQWATTITKQPGKNPLWRFTFDAGVFQGQTVLTLRQRDLTPFAVLTMLSGVGWPGFVSMVDAVQPAILEVLRQRQGQRPPTHQGDHDAHLD